MIAVCGIIRNANQATRAHRGANRMRDIERIRQVMKRPRTRSWRSATLTTIHRACDHLNLTTQWVATSKANKMNS